MNSLTAEILVQEGDYEGSLDWSTLIALIKASSETERLVIIAANRSTGEESRGELADARCKGLYLFLESSEQFEKVGAGYRSIGYVENKIRTSHTLLPMRRNDGGIEIKSEDFEYLIYPHDAVECPRPSQR